MANTTESLKDEPKAQSINDSYHLRLFSPSTGNPVTTPVSIFTDNIITPAATAALGYTVYDGLLTQYVPDDITSGTLVVGRQYQITTYVGGIPVTTSNLSGGTGYSNNTNVATTGGTGTGLTVDTTQQAGVIVSIVINTAGSGYTVGDTITITGGGANATFKIASITGDDFSNVADVQSGTINTNNCVFIATGTTPTVYSNGSTLHAYGIPIDVELRNNIGNNILYGYVSTGTMFAYLDVAFDFVVDKTFYIISPGNSNGYIRAEIGFHEIGNVLFIYTYDNTGTLTDGILSNTPLEIRIYQ